MEDEHPEWLPADWKVCVRVRSSGRKDKYYINPLNDIKFNSKPEVLRYLKEAENDLKLEGPNKVKVETRRTLGAKAENDLKLKEPIPNKTTSQRTAAEELPSGWIKEIKITKKGGKTRRDPYYVDPVSGHHFRSLQEVNRYLETKGSGKAEPNGEDTNHSSEELKVHSKFSTVVAEEQKLTDSKEDKILAGNESINSESSAVENSNSLEINATAQRDEKDSLGEDRKQENVKPQNKRKKSNHKWMNGLPRRTSKRLARMEAGSPLELETSNGAKEAVEPKAQVNTVKNTSGGYGKEKEPTSEPLNDISSSMEEHEASTGAREEATPSDEAEITTTIINTTGKSEIHLSGDVGKQKDIDLKEDDKNGMYLESSLNDLLRDPCIEFAIKMLTGAIPIEDANKVHNSSVSSINRASVSSSSLPFGDIWADPCFEFAVKTLTSEIPTENGSTTTLKCRAKK